MLPVCGDSISSITGIAALTPEDIQPALVQLKRKHVERNVAEDIAAKSGRCAFEFSLRQARA